MDLDLNWLLKRFMDQSTAMVYVLDTELRYLYLNKIARDVTSVVKERVSGKGDDEALIVNMMDSTSRMMSAMLRMQAVVNRS
jgi:PAS domain-containing protein